MKQPDNISVRQLCSLSLFMLLVYGKAIFSATVSFGFFVQAYVQNDVTVSQVFGFAYDVRVLLCVIVNDAVVV